MPRTNVVGATPLSGGRAQRCAQAGEREHHIDSTAGTAATTAARSSPLLSAYQVKTRATTLAVAAAGHALVEGSGGAS
jgi:hypothetical protein